MNLADKLSSYNIFNYLFTGVLFVVFAEKFTRYSFIQPDIVLGAFVYYFIGLVVSRFGSLLLEPLFKKLRIVRFAPYEDFVRASKADEQIVVLSEVNNMYRTICAVLISIAILRLYQTFGEALNLSMGWSMAITGSILLATFIFSYRKQTAYITRRITAGKRPK